MPLIATGYEDAEDCDGVRADPVFEMAAGPLPESGKALCSQPTMSRLENARSKVEIARMMVAMVDLFCASSARPPARQAPSLPRGGEGASRLCDRILY